MASTQVVPPLKCTCLINSRLTKHYFQLRAWVLHADKSTLDTGALNKQNAFVSICNPGFLLCMGILLNLNHRPFFLWLPVPVSRVLVAWHQVDSHVSVRCVTTDSGDSVGLCNCNIILRQTGIHLCYCSELFIEPHPNDQVCVNNVCW